MIKIVGGEFGSRKLIEPGPDEASRPYQARIREAVCNLLRGWFEDASVLDLFAGVGTMGLEAVSRGANKVVLVEKSHRTFEHLKQNIENLGCADRAKALHGDALSPHIAASAPQPVDLLFVDPPYVLMTDPNSRVLILSQIRLLHSIMADPSFAVLRSPIGPDDIDLEIEGWAGPEVHHYGANRWILLYQPIFQTTADSGAATGSVDTDS